MQFKKLRVDAIMPQRHSTHAAGFDLHANTPKRDMVIDVGEMKPVGTGIALWIEEKDTVGIIAVRSGLASIGLMLANGIGVIDSDYQGEIVVMLRNVSDAPRYINNGDRIAQIIFTQFKTPQFFEVKEFSQTTGRGTGGFGSTGKN